ncbi:hypothetical protein GCM10007989_25080 [Devosia pacifica]|uniref:Uncharacterized protein n=1 Tax=Devosia pacifica TaxID=1335967 RepID=A0A918S8B6_9HYPH|nr:hypothetical protein [Devosia pacifica]GHA28080.1 hypothetical protein GCM10007989_25080 [Devosia pacifica]
MNDTSRSDENGPEELTPEARQVLQRARRSFGFSVGILLLGFIAIGFALVYRAVRDAPPPEIAEAVTLAGDAEILSAIVSEGRINITYVSEGTTRLALFDAATGELLNEIAIEAD